ncbi:TAFII28-like protein, partial [Zopfochytrium polystomum]
FTQDELHRFEASRRSKLSKGVIKKVLQNILGMQNPSPKICIAVAGSAKIFVGEIVALALEVMSDWGETGALTPDHLREAYLRYQQKSNQSIR